MTWNMAESMPASGTTKASTDLQEDIVGMPTMARRPLMISGPGPANDMASAQAQTTKSWMLKAVPSQSERFHKHINVP